MFVPRLLAAMGLFLWEGGFYSSQVPHHYWWGALKFLVANRQLAESLNYAGSIHHVIHHGVRVDRPLKSDAVVMQRHVVNHRQAAATGSVCP